MACSNGPSVPVVNIAENLEVLWSVQMLLGPAICNHRSWDDQYSTDVNDWRLPQSRNLLPLPTLPWFHVFLGKSRPLGDDTADVDAVLSADEEDWEEDNVEDNM